MDAKMLQLHHFVQEVGNIIAQISFLLYSH